MNSHLSLVEGSSRAGEHPQAGRCGEPQARGELTAGTLVEPCSFCSPQTTLTLQMRKARPRGGGGCKHSKIHRLVKGFSRVRTHFYRIFQPVLSTTNFTTASLVWVLRHGSLKGWDLFF